MSDRIFRLVLGAGGAVVALLALHLFYVLARAAWPSLARFGPGFLTGQAWDPVAGDFGALPLIWGTLVSSVLACLVAVPLALGIAVYLSELAPPAVRGIVGFLVELVAAVPSVVIGLWGLFVVAPWLLNHVQGPAAVALGWTPFFAGPPLGVGMLTAALILAFMVIPIISAVAREVLAAVPREQREAMLALGATRWETIRLAVMRYGRAGLVGAVMLGFGRALGETMAVTMVIGNTPQVSLSLLAPAYTLASVLANEFTEAVEDLHLAALMEVGAVLFAVTMLVNVAGRLMVWRLVRAGAGGMRI